jgi:uncharacterized integral membrane protein (TIGR00698 family)
MNTRFTLPAVLFWLCVALTLMPLFGLSWVTPPVALALGLAFALVVEHPYRKQSSKATKLLLQISVVGLGFGLNIQSVMQAGLQGFWFTVATIVGTLSIGLVLGKLLNVHQSVSQLISVGTAICGGSAIAAVAPIIQADDADTSVALATVFVLNAAALFLFPVLGSALHLTQGQFGVWSAIAIHDTSSVVGAASRYGAEALAIATTIKLSRALWIIPIAFAFLWWQSRNARSEEASSGSTEPSTNSITIPYFIFGFIAASVVRTFVPRVAEYSPYLVSLAKVGLTLTLFLIGAGLSRATLKTVGVRPLVQGVVLWVFISLVTLWFVQTLV